MTDIIPILLEAEQLEGTQATVSQWLVNAGESVKKNQPIVDLETDKVAIEVTAPQDGKLDSINAQVGKTVSVDDLLATLCVSDSSKLHTTIKKAIGDEKKETTLPGSNSSEPLTSTTAINKSKKHLLGPAVKRLLNEHGIAPSQIEGSGQGERITKKDVLQHIQQNQTHSSAQQTDNDSTIIPHSPMRRAIADHMVDSLLNTSPHVTSIFEMDLSAIINHRAARKLGYLDAGANLTFTAYFLIACAKAIAKVPEVNSQFHQDSLEIFKQINIGIGTALDDKGLVVPVIRDVANKNLFQLASALTEQTEKARNRQLTASDMQGGTFTISNYGVSGSLMATPIIINQPQVAILGIGKMEKRVIVRTIEDEDKMLIKPMCYVSLSIDHRALDAHQTNNFLAAFVHEIENWPIQ